MSLNLNEITNPISFHYRVEDISDYDEDFTSRDHNIFIELLIAIWYAILSNTDLLCYMAALINQVSNYIFASMDSSHIK